MPNYITNRITLHGAAQTKISEVIDFLRSEDSEIDFNNIVPMPKELMKTEAGSQSDYAWAYYQARGLGDFAEIDKILDYEWVKREGIKTRDELLDSLLESHIECCKYNRHSERLFEGYEDIYKYGEYLYKLEQKYGYHEWYTWSRENWGTKWNACDARREGNTIAFETAWCGVPKLILMVSEKFQEVIFDYEFADEWFGHNTARYIFKGGEVMAEYEPKDDSEEAKQLAKSILGWEPSDDLEEDSSWYYDDDDSVDEGVTILPGESLVA